MNSGNAFPLETETPEETTVADKETTQPIEEASKADVIVPTGESDILNKFYLRIQLVLQKQVQPVQLHEQLACEIIATENIFSI